MCAHKLIQSVTAFYDFTSRATPTKGGTLDEINLALPRSRPATIRTDEGTIALLRRLACYYPDSIIAGILNRQGRKTAYRHRFETNHVASLRCHWGIPCFKPATEEPEGELLNVRKAAAALGVAPSTIHRLLNDGIIGGEQLTPGAPWRIRLTDVLVARFAGEAGDDFLPMREAMRTHLASPARLCCSVSSAASSRQCTSCVANKRDCGSK